MDNPYIKDNRQQMFNEICGCISELNDSDTFCSITIVVGHVNSRNVNLLMKKAFFDSQVSGRFHVGDRVRARFFIASKFKHGRWYTMANVLQVDAA